MKIGSLSCSSHSDWLNGQLNPFQDDDTHRREDGIYYGTSDAPVWLRFSQCTDGPLDISALQTALQDLSTTYSTASTNVQALPLFGGEVLMLSGPGSATCDYVVRLPVSVWNAKRGFMLESWVSREC
jgi:hypothetical protein